MTETVKSGAKDAKHQEKIRQNVSDVRRNVKNVSRGR